jgi:hypothetical protein
MTHDPAQARPETDPLHPGSGPLHVKRSPVAPGAERPDDDVPRQPHERDQSIDATADTPDPRLVQAQQDLAAGQMDTDMRAQPGLDAERRRQAVGGAGGQENPPRRPWVDPVQAPGSAPSGPDPQAPVAGAVPVQAAPGAAPASPAAPTPDLAPRSPTTSAPLSSQPPASDGGTRTAAGSNYGDWVPEREGRLHPDRRHPQDPPLAPPAVEHRTGPHPPHSPDPDDPLQAPA